MKLRMIVATLSLAMALVLPGRQISDTVSYPPPNRDSFVPPAADSSYTDPTFGLDVHRLTDAVGAGLEFLVTEYASTSNANANDTLIRLSTSNGGQWLYSLPTGGFVRDMGIGSSSPSDFWWHPTDADVLYHLDGTRFMAYSVAASSSSVVRDFGVALHGSGENNLSIDGSRIALQAGADVVLYDIPSDTIVATAAGAGGGVGISVGGDGQRVVINEGGVGISVYEISGPQLVFARLLFDRLGHQDVGQAPDGTDYLFMLRDTDNYVVAHRLSDGLETVIFPLGWEFSGALPMGMHISANSTHRDGWVYISPTMDANPDPAVQWPVYGNEIVRVQYDGSAIERLAHHRTQYNAGAGDTYYSTPRVTVSESGRFVFWSSNMRQRIITNPALPPDYADTYFLDFGAPAPPPTPPTTPTPWSQQPDTVNPALIAIVYIETAAPVVTTMLWDAIQADAELVASQNAGCIAQQTLGVTTWEVECTAPGGQTVTVVGRTDDPVAAAKIVQDNQ